MTEPPEPIRTYEYAHWALVCEVCHGKPSGRAYEYGRCYDAVSALWLCESCNAQYVAAWLEYARAES